MINEEIEAALEDCETAMSASNCPFTQWEKEFIESIGEQFDERGGLTTKQEQILEKIWDKI